MAKILIVDDEEDLLDLLRDSLKLKKHEVVTAQNGSEALTYAELNRDIDLVITDLHMPVMDGDYMCEQIYKIEDFKNLPVFVISAEKNQRYVDIANDMAKPVRYFKKPFNLKEVLAAIDEVVAGK